MSNLRVKVKAYATIRDAIGASVEVRLHEGASVEDLLNELTRSYGKRFSERILDEGGRLLPYVKLLVNGRDIDFLNRLETKLKDGDEVSLFPPVGGGRADRQRLNDGNPYISNRRRIVAEGYN